LYKKIKRKREKRRNKGEKRGKRKERRGEKGEEERRKKVEIPLRIFYCELLLPLPQEFPIIFVRNINKYEMLN
jgi:hypothetical protein